MSLVVAQKLLYDVVDLFSARLSISIPRGRRDTVGLSLELQLWSVSQATMGFWSERVCCVVALGFLLSSVFLCCTRCTLLTTGP